MNVTAVASVDDNDPLVEDLATLPVQLLASRLDLSGEQRLWIAAVEDALRGLASRSAGRRARERDWFLAEGEHIGSFRWIVASMGFDPDAWQDRIRRGISGVKVNSRM